MLIYREMKETDVEAIATLEKNIFPDAWSARSIRETFMQTQAMIMVAEEADVIIGYSIIYYVMDESEIARIAVEESKRHMGVAKSLLDEMILRLKEKGIQKILLDVRESNVPARRFYEKYGFSQDGIRKNYYEAPKEHAILMSKLIER